MSNLINLDDLGRKAAALQADIANDLSSAAGKMWDLGEMLNGAKARVNHGRWGVWLDRHGVHRRTAQRCMKINRDYTREAAITSTGQKLLAPPRKNDNVSLLKESEPALIVMLRRKVAALERELWFQRKVAEWLEAEQAGDSTSADSLYSALVTQLDEVRNKDLAGVLNGLQTEVNALHEAYAQA